MSQPTPHRYFADPRTRGQLLWTALVAIALGWVALEQSTSQESSWIATPSSPGAELVRAGQTGGMELGIDLGIEISGRPTRAPGSAGSERFERIQRIER